MFALSQRMLEVTGPAFVKLGQWMAIRSDLFPKEFCDVLCDLHDNVRPHGMRHNRRVIKKNLGKPIDELFSEFDPNPVGSGSIAQVHFAKLRSTGDEVAVKICHPRVRETIAVDFYCIQLMAQLADPYCRYLLASFCAACTTNSIEYSTRFLVKMYRAHVKRTPCG